jgi:hypothetical protein
MLTVIRADLLGVRVCGCEDVSFEKLAHWFAPWPLVSRGNYLPGVKRQ